MRHNVVAYLAKEGVSVAKLIAKAKKVKQINVKLDGLDATLILKKSTNNPKWLSLFSSVDIPNSYKVQTSVSAVLLMSTSSRLVAITFGHGRLLLDLNKTVRGFGLRIAMNLGDPKQLKSIDKSTLEKVPLKTRSQSSKNTGVENFGFEFDHEIVKAITAIVDKSRPDDETEIVSGYDSVSLHTNLTLQNARSIADRLVAAYKLDKYKELYPWAEYIEPETDKAVINQLDESLINALNSKNIEEFWMSPPDLIDYNDFSGFLYRESEEHNYHQELDLSAFLDGAGFRGDMSVSSFKRKNVLVCDGENKPKERWSAYYCLNGELEIDETRYVLNEGRWYRIQKSFYDEINTYFNSLDKCNIQFPDYNGKNEGPYLSELVTDKSLGLGLLDQKWIRPNGVTNNLEFCDLYSSCNAIIHVKKYGSSAVLNHLFAQAFQSIEMLNNSPEVIAKVNKHLEGTGLSLDFDPNETPRQHRIVLAIMYSRSGSLDMPFFAKVSLRHTVRRIKNMGFNVELAQIDIGKETS